VSNAARYRLLTLLIIAVVLRCEVACGQAGLRKSLDRLDRNENGVIEPDEITPLARPYLERILQRRSRGSRASFDRPIEISRIQEAAREYFAVKNGIDGSSVRPSRENSIKPFGPDEDQPMIPEFGLARVRFPYTKEDREEAEEIMGRYDRNGDRHIDRNEALRNRWTHRDPFDDDLDRDDRLSVMELTQRYARRRLLQDDVGELMQKAIRTGGEIRDSGKEPRREDSSRWWRDGGSDYWLTSSMLDRFDRNRNGRLEYEEAQRLGIPVGQIDADRNGEITREELFVYLSELQDEAGDVTEGLPGWFFELDENRDGQVAMHEFAAESEWSMAKHAEFDSMDLNTDGLLTPTEVLRASAVVGGSYRNDNAEVLPPQRTIISEIEIEDEFLIEELTVEISVTHTHTDHLDAYLTGPDGDRVELFTEVGGSGDHFEQTTFDDKSDKPITKAKPPFAGTYRPEAVDKKQPGLSRFRGKPIQGVWQLVIRGTRSDRFGMLHRWGMKVTPQEYDPLLQATASTDEGSTKESDEAADKEQGGSEKPSTEEPTGKESKEETKKDSSLLKTLGLGF